MRGTPSDAVVATRLLLDARIRRGTDEAGHRTVPRSPIFVNARLREARRC